MKRRTLLRNLISSVVALPVLRSLEAHGSVSGSLIDAADETHMQRAIRLAGNNPMYPFAAVLVDQESVDRQVILATKRHKKHINRNRI